MSTYLQSIEHARSASLVDLGVDVRNYEYNSAGSLAVYDPKSKTMYNLRPGQDPDNANQWRPTVYTMKRVLSIPSQKFYIDNKWNAQNDWTLGMSWVAIIGRKLIAFARGSGTHAYYSVFSIADNGDLTPIVQSVEMLSVMPNGSKTTQKSKAIVRGSSVFHLAGLYNGSYYRPAIYKFDFVDRDNELKVGLAKWLVAGANPTYGVIDGYIGTEYYSQSTHAYGMDFTYDAVEAAFVSMNVSNSYPTRMQFHKFDEDLKIIKEGYVDTGYTNGDISYYRHGITCPPGNDRIFFHRENASAQQEFLIFSVNKSDFSNLTNHHYHDSHFPGNSGTNWVETYGRSMAYIGNKLYMVAKDGSYRNNLVGFDYFKYPNFRSWVTEEKADLTYLARDYSSSTGTDWRSKGTSNNESYIEQMENNSDYFGEYTMGVGMVDNGNNRVFWYAWKNDFVGSNYPIGYRPAYFDVATTDMDNVYQMEIISAESQQDKKDKIYFNLEMTSSTDQVVTSGGLTLIGGQVNDLYKGV